MPPKTYTDVVEMLIIDVITTAAPLPTSTNADASPSSCPLVDTTGTKTSISSSSSPGDPRPPLSRPLMNAIKGMIIPTACEEFFRLPFLLHAAQRHDKASVAAGGSITPKRGVEEEEQEEDRILTHDQPVEDVPPPSSLLTTTRSGAAAEEKDKKGTGTKKKKDKVETRKEIRKRGRGTEEKPEARTPHWRMESSGGSASSCSIGREIVKVVEEGDCEEGGSEGSFSPVPLTPLLPTCRRPDPFLSSLKRTLGESYAAPFTSDMEFLKMGEVLFFLHFKRFREAPRGVDAQFFSLLQTCGIDLFQHYIPLVEKLREVLLHHMRCRIQAAKRLSSKYRLPRLIRFAKELGLSERQTWGLFYLAVLQCGSVLSLQIDYAGHPSRVVQFSGMSPAEFHHFIGKDREHMKQGNFILGGEYACLPQSRIVLGEEVAAALTGLSMSAEQWAKLERTKMKNVLENESWRHDGEEEEEEGGSGGGGRRRLHGLGKGIHVNAASVNHALMHNLRKTSSAKKGRLEGVGAHGVVDRSPAVLLLDEEEAVLEGEEAVEEDPSSEEKEEMKATHLDIEKDITKKRGPIPARSSPKTCKTRQWEEAKGTEEDNDEDEEKGESEEVVEKPETTTSVTTPSVVAADCACATSAGAKRPTEVDVASAVTEDKFHTPYEDNCECMEVAFHIITLKIKFRNAKNESTEEEDCGRRARNEGEVRGMKAMLRVAEQVHRSRIQATIASGKFIPEIEVMASKFHLSELEKDILLLLVGASISHDVLVAINGGDFLREGQRLLTVGFVIFVLCNGLHQRVEARQSFLPSSPLIAHSVVSLSPPDSVFRSDTPRTMFNSDLVNYLCDIDRKIVDLLVGKEISAAELVPGSTVISPSVCLDRVVLPRATLDTVFSRLNHFSLVKECKQQCHFGDGLGESKGGLVILFYGPSGTGKTMLAHAVAHELKRKLLLVSLVPFYNSTNAPEMLRFVFREAKLTDSIIFFDECQSLFASRTHNRILDTLLVEFEKYDGIMLMATNAAQCFDEAMNRRISLMVEFKPPDHIMRLQIWRSHLPSALSLDKSISLEQLALNYELTGGLIRNAVLAAISSAVARENSAHPTLTMEDLETGAKQQLRGFFMAAKEGTEGVASGQRAYFTPKRCLEELILDVETKQKIEYVANLTKSRSTLFASWGFTEENAGDKGSMHLLYGPPGTGKSLAAEGIAYECGLTIRLCNANALLAGTMMEAGLTGKGDELGAVFTEALQLGAMIVVEEAQVLLKHGLDSPLMRLFLYHALRHTKPVLLLATTSQYTSIDTYRHHLPITTSILFRLPREKERAKIWRLAFPAGVPLENDMKWDRLSPFELSPREIERVAFRTCCRTALLPEPERVVRMKVIEEEIEEERRRQHAGREVHGMFT